MFYFIRVGKHYNRGDFKKHLKEKTLVNEWISESNAFQSLWGNNRKSSIIHARKERERDWGQVECRSRESEGVVVVATW